MSLLLAIELLQALILTEHWNSWTCGFFFPTEECHLELKEDATSWTILVGQACSDTIVAITIKRMKKPLFCFVFRWSERCYVRKLPRPFCVLLWPKQNWNTETLFHILPYPESGNQFKKFDSLWNKTSALLHNHNSFAFMLY